MEIDRPDRKRGYEITLQVGVMLALSYSLANISWEYIDEYFYTKNGNTTFYFVMTFANLLGNVLGAWAAGQLAFKY